MKYSFEYSIIMTAATVCFIACVLISTICSIFNVQWKLQNLKFQPSVIISGSKDKKSKILLVES